MKEWNNWTIEFDDRLPIYQQIVDSFCRSLVKGETIPGERIPSIRDLAAILKVNANTVQRVYQEMERKDLIFSRRGTGYFVTEEGKMIKDIQIEMAKESMQHFLAEMRALGFQDQEIIEELRNSMKGEEEDGNAN